MTKRRWRWVTRDVGSNMVEVRAESKKPMFVDGIFPWLGDRETPVSVCAIAFAKLFVAINPGQCVRVEFPEGARILDT